MRQTRTGSFLDPINSRQSNGFENDKINVLTQENQNLKEQLRQAMSEINALREENNDLRSMLGQQKKITKTPESTFITKGADQDFVNCENCGKEIKKDKYQLHFNFCIKNVTKCTFCYEPVETAEMKEHIEEQRGNRDQWFQAIQDNNTLRLQRMQEHGFDIFGFKDENGYCLIHYAVKQPDSIAINIIDFLSQNSFNNIDEQNSYGETALHLVCGKTPNVEIARRLILKGANPNIKNALGDTAFSVAQRAGNHQFALILQKQQEQMNPYGTSQKFYQNKEEPQSAKRTETRGGSRANERKRIIITADNGGIPVLKKENLVIKHQF